MTKTPSDSQEATKPASFLRQALLKVRLNAKLKARKWRWSFIEIATPLLLVFVWAAFSAVLPGTQLADQCFECEALAATNQRHDLAYLPSALGHYKKLALVGSSNVTSAFSSHLLRWYPGASASDLVPLNCTDLTDAGLPSFANATVSFDDEASLEAYVASEDYGKSIERPQIYAAIVFSSFPSDLGGKGSWAYRIRMNSTATPSTVALGDPLAQDIRLSYVVSYVVTAAEGSVTDDSIAMDSAEYQAGFVQLQLAVDRFILNRSLPDGLGPVSAGAPAPNPAEMAALDRQAFARTWRCNNTAALNDPLVAAAVDKLLASHMLLPQAVTLAPFPRKAYLQSRFFAVVQNIFPLLFCVSFFPAVYGFIRDMVAEREGRLKDSMRLMGFTDAALVASWAATYAIELTVIMFAVSIVMKASFFASSGFGYIFALFWLLAMSSLTFAWAIACMFQRAKLAAIAGVTLFLAAAFPYFRVQTPHSDEYTQRLYSLLSPTGFSLALDVVSMLEASGAGLRWDTTDSEEFTGYSFRFGVLILLLDTVLYAILAWYLQTVLLDHTDGIQRPPWFPCTRSYWTGRDDGQVKRARSAGALWRSAKRSFLRSQFMISLSSTAIFTRFATYTGLWRLQSINTGAYHQGAGVSSLVEDYEDGIDEALFHDTETNNSGPPSSQVAQGPSIELPGPSLLAHVTAKRVVKVRNLRKVLQSSKQGPRTAVDGVSFDAFPGQITCIVGQEGSGTSVLLGLLSGALPPTSGSINVFGQDLRKCLRSIRRDLGVCPSHDVLWPELTALQHLRFYAGVKGLQPQTQGKKSDSTSVAIDDDITQIARDLGLNEALNVRASKLSYGQRRKLSIAISLVGSKLVLLDEPTAGMDPDSRLSAWQALRAARSGRVIIVCTQLMQEAENFGDRIVILNRGKLSCCGSAPFLKKLWSVGYTLSLRKSESGRCDVEAISAIVRRHVPSAKQIFNYGPTLSFWLPVESSSSFPAMLSDLEKGQGDVDAATHDRHASVVSTLTSDPAALSSSRSTPIAAAGSATPSLLTAAAGSRPLGFTRCSIAVTSLQTVINRMAEDADVSATSLQLDEVALPDFLPGSLPPSPETGIKGQGGAGGGDVICQSGHFQRSPGGATVVSPVAKPVFADSARKSGIKREGRLLDSYDATNSTSLLSSTTSSRGGGYGATADAAADDDADDDALLYPSYKSLPLDSKHVQAPPTPPPPAMTLTHSWGSSSAGKQSTPLISRAGALAELVRDRNRLTLSRLWHRWLGFWRQFRAMYLKRYRTALRDRRAQVFQLLIPSICMACGLWLLKDARAPPTPAMPLSLGQFNQQLPPPAGALWPTPPNFIPWASDATTAALLQPFVSGAGTGIGAVNGGYGTACGASFVTLDSGYLDAAYGQTQYASSATAGACVNATDAVGWTPGDGISISGLQSLYGASSSSHGSNLTHLWGLSQWLLDHRHGEEGSGAPSDAQREYGASRYGALRIESLAPATGGGPLPPGSGAYIAYQLQTNTTMWHALPTFMNVLHSGLLAWVTGSNASSISVTNAPLPAAAHEVSGANKVEALIAVLIMMVGLAFIPPIFAVTLVKERARGVKHLQLLAGSSLTAYWASLYAWELTSMILPYCIFLAMIWAFGVSELTEGGAGLASSTLFFFYCASIAPFTHVGSAAFGSHFPAQTYSLILNLIGVIQLAGSFTMNQINSSLSCSTDSWLGYIYPWFPLYSLGSGLNGLLTRKDMGMQSTGSCGGTTSSPSSSSGRVYGPWDFEVTGAPFLYLTFELAVYSLLAYSIEFSASSPALRTRVNRLLALRWWDRLSTADAAQSAQPRHTGPLRRKAASSSSTTSGLALLADQDEEDDDVVAEARRVDTGTAAAQQDVLILKHAHKLYRGQRRATVQDLSLGVPIGQAFGLLGGRSSGKSTLLRIIMGEELPSSGSVHIAGHSLLNEYGQASRCLSYAPQNSALESHLSVREHLELYAGLHSLAPADAARVISDKLQELDLTSVEHRRVSALELSDRKKLSLAIATLVPRPLLLLDQPTEGVEPQTRRKLWRAIARVTARGGSILLSTNSMEECEALCSRIGIAVAGRLRCVGTPQKLKQKFGRGWLAAVRLRPPLDITVQAIEATVKSHLGGAYVTSAELRELCAGLGAPHRAAALLADDSASWGLHMSAALRDGSSGIEPAVFANWYATEDAVAAVSSYVARIFPGSRLVDRHGELLRYGISKTAQSRFLSSVFTAFEYAKGSLGLIADYSISEPSLGDVYSLLGSQQEDVTSSTRGSSSSGGGGGGGGGGAPTAII